MASNMKHKPTGFLDLPLELRELVYEQLLPPDKVVKFGKTGCQIQRDMISICESDARVREEIASWEHKRCTTAHFMVTPGVWHRPESFYHFKNLEWIVIGINHYEMNQSRIEKILEIWNMCGNLEKIVRTIRTYYKRNERMPNLCVAFRQHHRESGRGDLHWCKPLDWDQSSTGDLLATIDGTPYSETIFTHLLEPLLALPPCRKARIKVLENLHGDGPEDYELDHSGLDEAELLNDHWHAESFGEMMEAWLEGRISREIPFEDQWRRYKRAFWRGSSDPEYKSILAALYPRKGVVQDESG